MRFHGQTGGRMPEQAEATDQGGEQNVSKTEMSEKERALLEEVKQLREDRRTAREETAELRKLFMMNQNREQERIQNLTPTQQKEEELLSRFDPEAKTAIETMMARRVDSALNPMKSAMVGLLAKADIDDFKSLSGKNYSKYKDRVESAFQELQMQGKAMPRATLYRQLRADDLDSGKIKFEQPANENDDNEDSGARNSAMKSFSGGGSPRSRSESTNKTPDFSRMNLQQREKALKEMEKGLSDIKL